MDEQLMTTAEVAQLLRMTPQSLKAARNRNTVSIPHVRVGKNRVLYKRSDVLAWIEANRTQ